MAEARVLYGGQGGSILYGGGSWRPGIPFLIRNTSMLVDEGGRETRPRVTHNL